MTVAQRILVTARGELGVHEVPDGSNRGPQVDVYRRTTWLSTRTGWPWCVAFAWTWVTWKQVLEKPCPYPTASVAQLESWARKHGYTVGTGLPGDLACLGGRHVTIAETFNRKGDSFVGLGGNQANAVRRSNYRISAVTTWIRPGLVHDPPPPVRAPVYELVRGEGERSKIVFKSRDLGAVTRRAKKVLKAGARSVRIRKRKP